MKRVALRSAPVLLALVIAAVCGGCTYPMRSARQFAPIPDVAAGGPDANHARIYLFAYLGAPSVGPGLDPPAPGHWERVWDGDKTVGDIYKNHYICWDREPGAITLRRNWWFTEYSGVGIPSDEFVINHGRRSWSNELRADAGNTHYFYAFGKKVVPISEKKARKFISRQMPPKLAHLPGPNHLEYIATPDKAPVGPISPAKHSLIP